MENLIFINKYLIDLIEEEVKKQFYSVVRPGINLRHELRDIIEGIFYIDKTGIQRKYCVYKNIKGSAIMYHFYKWSKADIFGKVWIKIYDAYQKNIKYKRNLKKICCDCTIIKSINGEDCIGKNPTDRGRNATKISILTDLLGVPVGYCIDAANNHDNKLFNKTLENKIIKQRKKTELYVDKGYSSNKCKNIAEDWGFTLMCENKSNAVNKIFPENIKVNKVRYIVESFNSWLKSYRKMRLRYEKKVKYFKSFLLLSFSMITCSKMKEGGHLEKFLQENS